MLDDLPVIDDVKQEYKQLRVAGNSRAEATRMLIESYACEINDADDGPLFWIGLADAQFACKELSQEAADRGLKALDDLENTEAGALFGNRQIAKHRERYAQAPMPERAKITVRKRFQCTWQIGDVYAYKLKGECAQKLGIEGKYMLLRKVDTVEWDNDETHPVATFTFWDRPEFPKTAEEFGEIRPLRHSAGRHLQPENRYDYRIDILFTNKKQVDALELIYVGNFPNVPAPQDELVIREAGSILMASPKEFDEDCCVHYHNNLYYHLREMGAKLFSLDTYRQYLKPMQENQNRGTIGTVPDALTKAKKLLQEGFCKELTDLQIPVEALSFSVHYDHLNYCWLIKGQKPDECKGMTFCVVLCDNGDVLSIFSCPTEEMSSLEQQNQNLPRREQGRSNCPHVQNYETNKQSFGMLIKSIQEFYAKSGNNFDVDALIANIQKKLEKE